jgi:hypothetical protein
MLSRRPHNLYLCLLTAFILAIESLCPLSSFAAGRRMHADVVIYGGTPAGLAAAYALTRRHRTVIVIEPTRFIGGMITGGIAIADTGTPQFVGGIAREFFQQVARLEKATAPDDAPAMLFHGKWIPWTTPRPWDIEPKNARRVFEDWSRTQKYQLILNEQVQSVTKSGARIISIRLTGGQTIAGRVFIDASYEGDLLARAGVSYTFGRESESQYGESMAGVRPPYFLRNYSEAEYAAPTRAYMHLAQFGGDIRAFDEHGHLLWGVEPGPLGQVGSADQSVQAYCYRLIATQRPDLRLPWPKPELYNPAHFELLLRYIRLHPEISFTHLVHLAPIPNGKWDLNASGPFSIDMIGGNKGFVDANYTERAEILRAHREYEQGFFWFLAHDPRVPSSLRDEVNSWGPAADEWADNGHWPGQIYIREARRMVGSYVMTQRDVLQERTKPDSIGLGSFVLDSHWVRRFADANGNVRVEGHLDESIDLSKTPYEIPYRAIIPKAQDASNLIVPVCVSASHIAYSTIRMEPVYMILGHAAGDAAAIALQSGASVQQIDVGLLKKRLAEEGQIMTASQSRPLGNL